MEHPPEIRDDISPIVWRARVGRYSYRNEQRLPTPLWPALTAEDDRPDELGVSIYSYEGRFANALVCEQAAESDALFDAIYEGMLKRYGDEAEAQIASGSVSFESASEWLVNKSLDIIPDFVPQALFETVTDSTKITVFNPQILADSCLESLKREYDSLYWIENPLEYLTDHNIRENSVVFLEALTEVVRQSGPQIAFMRDHWARISLTEASEVQVQPIEPIFAIGPLHEPGEDKKDSTLYVSFEVSDVYAVKLPSGTGVCIVREPFTGKYPEDATLHNLVLGFDPSTEFTTDSKNSHTRINQAYDDLQIINPDNLLKQYTCGTLVFAPYSEKSSSISTPT